MSKSSESGGSDEKKDAPREFQPVDDPTEARKLLREGAKTLATAMIWTKNQGRVVNSHLTVYSESGQVLYAWIPKDLDPLVFMDELARDGSADCYFSVSLSRANIFFKATFAGHDEAGLKFRLPDKVFKVQRRKDLRFPIPDGHTLKVQFQDPLFPETILSRKALDISASGLALLISEQDETMFQVGMTLHSLSFSVRGRKIECEGEIRHKKAMPPDSRTPGVKIGVLFRGLGQGDEQAIAQHVFEESRKFFTRLM